MFSLAPNHLYTAPGRRSLTRSEIQTQNIECKKAADSDFIHIKCFSSLNWHVQHKGLIGILNSHFLFAKHQCGKLMMRKIVYHPLPLGATIMFQDVFGEAVCLQLVYQPSVITQDQLYVPYWACFFVTLCFLQALALVQVQIKMIMWCQCSETNSYRKCQEIENKVI